MGVMHALLMRNTFRASEKISLVSPVLLGYRLSVTLDFHPVRHLERL
jgi:hypothetical protein